MAYIDVVAQYNEEMEKLVCEPALPEKFNDRYGQLLNNDAFLKAKISQKLNQNMKGVANGVAELDTNGLVPSSQLPSYVDDVIEGYLYEGVFYTEDTHVHPIPAEKGKIYVDLSSGQDGKNIYRWSGSLFVVISNEYQHPEPYQPMSSGLYKITTDACGHVVAADKATKEDIIALGIPEANEVKDNYAKKSIYDDTAVSMGRESKSTVGNQSFALGTRTIASEENAHAEGYQARAVGKYAFAMGCGVGSSNFGSHAIGKYNKNTADGATGSTQVGDVFVIGNGTGYAGTSNAFRVTYTGATYGKGAYNTSGADYAEFIKPWADGNNDNEDRVGYFVTVKDGFLHKANEGDYIVGITSGNPSIVGAADEDYYWRYARDEFNRIVMEDAPEETQKIDADGNPVFDTETNEPIMIETGNVIPNARMKQADDYDPSLQEKYIERKDRKEWDYVGMLGVLPVRDDGTCLPGHFCTCGTGGIATLATTRGFDTYMVIERIADYVVSVILT